MTRLLSMAEGRNNFGRIKVRGHVKKQKFKIAAARFIPVS